VLIYDSALLATGERGTEEVAAPDDLLIRAERERTGVNTHKHLNCNFITQELKPENDTECESVLYGLM
jgi:hypothetical protein